MRGKNVIVINGHEYDALTGLPLSSDSFVSKEKPVKSAKTHSSKKHAATKNNVATPQKRGKVFNDIGPAPRSNRSLSVNRPQQRTVKAKPALTSKPVSHTSVHARPERSHTLNRSAIKRPTAQQVPTRSPQIQKFAASSPAASKPAEVKVNSGDVLSSRQVADDAINTAPRKQAVKPVSAKEQLIKQGMDKVDTTKKHKPVKQKKNTGHKKPRFASAMGLVAAVLLLGAYMTYVNMPGISVRVASSRAGIVANYPEYTPDGYRFNGPVSFTAGEVMISFKSKSGNLGYSVSQRASNWDSQAVLDNYVTEESESYLTYSAQGLTVYTFDNSAAWVNGGILYTINGDAPLSNEQVLKIAASL